MSQYKEQVEYDMSKIELDLFLANMPPDNQSITRHHNIAKNTTWLEFLISWDSSYLILQSITLAVF